ncbi:MAG: sterol desaturase family protein [Ginsengibacter sp.]
MYLPYYSHFKHGFEPWKILFIFAGGIIFWTLFEYLMHRFFFHLAAQSNRTRRVIYVMHGNHHEFPRDRERLFMPPIPSLLISSLLFLMMYLVIGKNALAFFPGFILGYLIYGSMHFAIHAWKPPFKWMKPLWQNHYLHHYKNDEKGFGVSTILWDKIFGTSFN